VPTKAALKRNFPWLAGILKKCPDATPSYYFIADCLLMLHRKVEDKLFQGTSQEVTDFAVREGNKLKTLVTKARRLYTKTGKRALASRVEGILAA
jgi:hypothetical protein